MKVCFLVESFVLSGGNYVIAEHAHDLLSRGHEVVIATLRKDASERLAWHPALAKMRILPIEEAAHAQFDIAFATWWRTVYELPRLQARRHAYFVQGIENLIYPDPADAAKRLAEATYAQGLTGITVSSWARDRLNENFGMELDLVPPGITKALYTEDGPAIASRRAERLRVLVEGPLGNPFKNTARSIELALKSGADEVWLLTSSNVRRYPGATRVFARVPVQDCAPIYRSCDVLLKLSVVESFALPILEMFHCGGTAVMFDIPGPGDFVRAGENALVVPLGDETGVIAALNQLKAEPQRLESLKRGALATARAWPSWPQASAEFEAALQRIMSSPPWRQAAEAPGAGSPHPEDKRASPLKTLLRKLRGRMPGFDARVTAYVAKSREGQTLSLPGARDREKYFRPSILAGAGAARRWEQV